MNCKLRKKLVFLLAAIFLCAGSLHLIQKPEKVVFTKYRAFGFSGLPQLLPHRADMYRLVIGLFGCLTVKIPAFIGRHNTKSFKQQFTHLFIGHPGTCPLPGSDAAAHQMLIKRFAVGFNF